MAETYRSGRAAVTVEQRQLLTQIDRITEGAGTSFLDAARASLTTTTEEAAPQWMERTGATKRSFVIRDDISPDRVSVTALNTATNEGFAYPYRVRFSYRTAQSLEAEVSRHRNDQALHESEITAGKHGIRDLGKFYGWFRKTRGRPYDAEDRARRWRAQLRESHGEGSPSTQVAGKQAWSLLVRRPAKRRERALIDTVRADLAKLAGG